MTPALLTVLGTILVATIGVAGSALLFYLTKRHEQKVKWQQAKLNHYRVLMSSFSDWVGGGTDKDDAKRNFALAVNTIALVAPQNVIAALAAFVDVMVKSGRIDEQKWNSVVLAARQDIGLSNADEETNVFVPLVSAGSPNSENRLNTQVAPSSFQ